MFILSCGLTQFMSNTAAAALLAPIGISIAQSIGASPYPVLMAIGIAASCAFTTPVATPPNTLCKSRFATCCNFSSCLHDCNSVLLAIFPMMNIR